jgi:hypothetical protein
MELLTPRFGPIAFDPQEVIVFEHGLQGWKELRQWLLLADSHHPALLWLQSIRRPLVALPLVCLQAEPGLQLRLSRGQFADRSTPLEDPWVLLVPLLHEDQFLSFDLQNPILIDTGSHRGLQLWREGEQTLQHARSEQLVRLRKCA